MQAGRTLPFRRGDRLIVAGAPSDKVLLLRVGIVKVALPSDRGPEPVVTFLGPGELLGEWGVLRSRPRSAHIVALTPGSAIHVPGSRFLQLHQEHPDVRELVNRTFSRRQERADTRQLVAGWDVTSRLAMSLLCWAAEVGRRTPTGVHLVGMTQHDIASAIGASPKSVEAAFGVLRAEGLVETGRLKYRIPRPSALVEWLSSE